MKDAIKNVLGKIINYKYFEIIAIFIYKIILDLIFLTYMKDYNIYYISDFSIYKWGISIILMLILYKIIHSVKEDIIRFFIKIFYLLMFIPISTVYMGRNFSTFWYVILFLEIALIVFTIKLIRYLIKSKIFKKCIKKVKFNINYEFTTKLIYYIFIINTLVVLFLCVYYNGWPTLEALNFRHVYQVREQFYLPKFGNYLYTFEITFILQFLLILYLHKKKYIKLSMVIFVSIFLYLIKGEKVVLLSIILVICSYKIFQYGKKYMERIIPVVMSIILPLTLMFGHSNMMTAVIITRLLIIPANLKFLYFDFFSNNPKIGIVGTVLNAFLKLPNPYDQMPYQNLIAGIYLNDYNMYSNTGMLVEGYARFGYIGLLIIPIIMGIVLNIINYGTKRNGDTFILGIAIFPIMFLNESYLLSSLLFGEFLLLICTCIFFDVNKLNFLEIKKKVNTKTFESK